MKRRNFLSMLLLPSASALLADEDLLISTGADELLIASQSDGDLLLPTYTVDKESPEIWYWSHEGCLPCVRFKNDYKANKEGCGFVAVEQKGQRPVWMPDSDPQFWWHIKEKVPTQKDINNTRHIDGYVSWKDLTARFKLSREPKQISQVQQVKQVGGPAKDPFAQPDQRDTRAVARNVGYHLGHSCPNCGKAQFNIENDAGPNHTHRCSSCRTAWYHADQIRTQKTFSWIS